MTTPSTPGIGYRFIDPAKDTKRKTDEYWDTDDVPAQWRHVASAMSGWSPSDTYRRKRWTSEPIPDDWPDDTAVWIWVHDIASRKYRLSTMKHAADWRAWHRNESENLHLLAWMIRDESETEPPDPYEPEMSEHKNLRICTNESDEKWIKAHLQDIDHLVGLVEESFETNTSCLLSPVLRRLILDHAKKVKSQRRQLAGRTLHFDNCGEPLK